MKPSFLRITPLIGTIAALLSPALDAQIPWANPAVDNNWNNAANWVGGNVPDTNTEQAVFDVSDITAISLSAATTVNKLTFGAGAAGYTFSGAALDIDINTTAATADGILTTAGGGSVTFNNAVTMRDSNGNNAGVSFNTGLGTTITFNAATSTISNRNLQVGGNGTVVFNGSMAIGTGQLQQAGNATIELFTNPTASGQIRSFSNGGGGIRIHVNNNRALGLGVTGNAAHDGRIFLVENGVVTSGALTTGGGSVNGATMDVTFGAVIAGAGTATHSGGFTLANLGAGITGSTGLVRIEVGDDDTLNITGNVTGTLGGYSAPLLRKQGSGVAFMSGTNTYTIPTEVAAGTLLVTPTQTGNSVITVNDGARFGVRLKAAGTTFSTPSLAVGSVTGANLILDTLTFGNPTVPMISALSFSTVGTVNIDLTGIGLSSATSVPLIDYDTAIGGAGFGALTVSTPFRVLGTLVDNGIDTRVDVNLTADTPKWIGNVSNIWDIDNNTGTVGTLNWRTSSTMVATGYVESGTLVDSVIFDDSATGSTTVELQTTVTPVGVTFANTTKDYTLTGSGNIAGTTGIVKSGTGTVTFMNTNAFSYTGTTQIDDGTIQLGDGVSFGAGNLGTGNVAIAAGGSLSINRLEDYSFPNATSGGGNVIKDGGNNVTATGALTHTGLTAIISGTLTLSPSGAFSLASAIAGVGDLVKQAGATVRLTGDNVNHTGRAIINGGTLQVGDGAIGNPVGGAGLSGNLGTGEVSIIAGGISLNRNDQALVVPNVISGGVAATNAVTVAGAFGSIVTLSGNNTFLGNINVSGGGLRITRAEALGTGAKTITLTNGTAGRPGLYLDGSGGSINIPASVSFSTSSQDAVNPALVNLAGDNSIAGNFTMTAGGGATRIRVDAGTLTISGSFTPNTTARVLILEGVSGGLISGAINNQNATNTLGLQKNGAGTWRLTGANNYSAGTTINGGTLLTTTAQNGGGFVTIADGATFGVTQLGAGAVFGTSSLTLGASTGATLILDAAGFGNPATALLTAPTLTVNGSSTLELRGGGFSAGQFTALDYDTVIGGAGFAGLTLVHSSRITAALVDNVGNTSVDINVTAVNFPRWNGDLGGNWDFDNGLGTGSDNWREQTSGNVTRYRQNAPDTDSVVFNDAALGTTTVILTSALTPASVTVDNSTLAYTFTGGGSIAGGGALVKTGSGTLVIANTAPNTYSGGTGIVAGTVQIGDGVTAGAGSLGSGPVTVDGALALNRPDDFALGGAINGTGLLVKNNTNTVSVSAPFNFGGSVQINAGALSLDAGGTSTASITNNGTLAWNSAGALNGALAGSGAIAVSGAGNHDLGGIDANTNTGTITVNTGATLRLNKTAGTNATGGDIVINGGTLSWVAGDQVADTASITLNTGNLALGNRPETLVNLSIFDGPANITGTIPNFSGANITGVLTVTAGVKHDAVNSAGTTTANRVIVSNASLFLGANSGDSIFNIGPGGISFDNASITYGSTGNAARIARVNLDGDVTSTGASSFFVNTGNPMSQVDLGAASRTFDVTAGTLTVDPAITSATPGIGFIKEGPGTMILSAGTNTNGISTYTGDTVVNDGTLVVNGSITGSNIIVNGGTLAGDGSITTDLLGFDLNVTGKLAPGTDGSAGTLDVILGGNAFDISDAVASVGSASLLFDLGAVGFSDIVTITGSHLELGISVLEFDDFVFNALPGFGEGDYVLFDGDTLIPGVLGANISGIVGGFTGELQFADGGNDLILHVPEPGSALLLLGGIAMLATRRRKA